MYTYIICIHFFLFNIRRERIKKQSFKFHVVYNEGRSRIYAIFNIEQNVYIYLNMKYIYMKIYMHLLICVLYGVYAFISQLPLPISNI